MEKNPVTILIRGTGIDRNGWSVEFSPHGESDVEPFSKLGRCLDGVDGAGCHFDPGFFERQSARCEVNQLVTTVRSPVASIEQHGCP